MNDEFDKYEDVDDEQYERLAVELRIDVALKKRGMTQKELAELTGIRPAAISQLYRGFVERLNLDHIARIANALGITDIRELIQLNYESEIWNMSNTKQQREYLREKNNKKASE